MLAFDLNIGCYIIRLILKGSGLYQQVTNIADTGWELFKTSISRSILNYA